MSILRFSELQSKQDVADWIKAKRADGWSDGELADELHYRAIHAMPHVSPHADVSESVLIVSESDTEAVTERAAILADANAWPFDACERIARVQVSARVARERATLTPAQRLALETTDPQLRDIYAQLAALSG